MVRFRAPARKVAGLKARRRQAEDKNHALDDLPGAGDPGASRPPHLRLIHVATQVPAAPVSFTRWLAELGMEYCGRPLTLADLGHTADSMEAAERDFDAQLAAAIEDRRLRRSRRHLRLADTHSGPPTGPEPEQDIRKGPLTCGCNL